MSRIVQLANFVGPRSGGLRTTLTHLARGYAAAGHEVVHIVPGGQPAVHVTEWGRRVVLRGLPLPGTGYRVVVAREQVERVVHELRPDRLEVHDRLTFHGVAAATGVPALVISHERLDRVLAQWVPVHGRLLAAVADRRNTALARGHEQVVCTTAWAGEEFTRLGLPVTRVPLGVDLGRFRPPAGTTVRDRLSEDGAALLVLASRLSREKRPALAIDTVAELVRRGRRVQLVIAGDGPLWRALEARAAGLPVRFLGFVAEPERLAGVLAAADVALAPGPVETFGLAALEALASGTPVVADAGSALPELLGAAGGLAVPGRPGEFADAVEAVLDAPNRFEPRARAERFPWSATVAGFLLAHRLPAPPMTVPG